MEAQTYTVTQLTERIKKSIETSVGTVWVEGEISNLRRHTSGITYFTLKDAHAQLNVILFANVTVDFAPVDGQAVRIHGPVTVYPPQGKYQIVVRRMEPAGQGELMARFEALKQKLKAEGLFDRPRRKIPLLPQHIGIVTSPTGAALRDILNILGRRFPNLDILIRGARVQGDGAAEEIALGIQRLNAVGDPDGQVLPDHPPIDVIIVTRGGGSLEDLWPFNEEVVARAIAASRIPVISAVGHEIDTTISDFVADLRCPTPSAAAEQLIAPKRDLEEQVATHARRLGQMGTARSTARRLAVARATAFQRAGHAVEHFRQRLDHLQTRAQGAGYALPPGGRRCSAPPGLGRLRVERCRSFACVSSVRWSAHATGARGQQAGCAGSREGARLNCWRASRGQYHTPRRWRGGVSVSPRFTCPRRPVDGTITSVVEATETRSPRLRLPRLCNRLVTGGRADKHGEKVQECAVFTKILIS